MLIPVPRRQSLPEWLSGGAEEERLEYSKDETFKVECFGDSE
jgi:hypothetical protein